MPFIPLIVLLVFYIGGAIFTKKKDASITRLARIARRDTDLHIIADMNWAWPAQALRKLFNTPNDPD